MYCYTWDSTTSLNKCANAWNSFSLSETKPKKYRMWWTLHTYIHNNCTHSNTAITTAGMHFVIYLRGRHACFTITGYTAQYIQT